MNRAKDRYGFDEMGLWALAAAAVCVLIPYGFVVSLALIGWSLFRAVSTNTQARRAESTWFSNHTRGLRGALVAGVYKIRLWWRKLLERMQYMRTYKVFKCKSCSQKLRVPRGKGRLKVTCKSCGEQFSINS